MAYTLEQLASDCRSALDSDEGPGGRHAICKLVSRACLDPQFVETHLGEDNIDPRKLLYEDPDRGFCIFAHVYQGASDSKPHDHGPSWAIYGQVSGETRMTDWEIHNARPVESKSYTLAPGDVYLYNEGDIHSPRRTGTTRLIRIEGVNMDGVERRWFDPA